MTKQIPLTHGKYTLIDDDMYEYLSQWKWYFNKDGYASKSSPKVSMHRIIINAQKFEIVDHINGDKLDNRRSNLRICTNAENVRNQSRRARNTSGYKGVSLDKRTGKYKAYIQPDRVFVWLGAFKTPEEAARAYDTAAEKYFGDFARKNLS
jgi:hypothetical protein